MKEVGAPSETQRAFRYSPLPGGALVGVPATLVFRVEEGGATPSVDSVESFDHLAISCVSERERQRDADRLHPHKTWPHSTRRTLTLLQT